VARIATFHDPEADADIGHELRLVVAKLRLQVVETELQALFDAGANTADAQRRGRALMEERSRLKR
jgi:DNA primase